jgi:hypothetical protein
MKRRIFILSGSAILSATSSECGAVLLAQLNQKTRKQIAPAPSSSVSVSGLRPFRDDSIWNVAIDKTASRSVWVVPWSSTTTYRAGDLVRTSVGSETYLYVSVRGGVAKALPSGQSSNSDWTYCGVSVSQWYDSGGGTPVFQGTASDPTWTLRFNLACYGNLSSGAWPRRISDLSLSDRIWSDSATTVVYPTDYNAYVTVSAAALVPPSSGSFDPKGKGITDAQLVPWKALHAPADLLPSLRGTDWTLVVHLSDGTVLETFATVILTGNRIVCSSYKITYPNLAGDGWQNGFRASMVPGYAGLIRQAEWSAAWTADTDSGGLLGTIPHALALLAPANLLVQAAAYPAYAWDSQASGRYTGTSLRMGERLALPANFALDAPEFTSSEARFARIIGRTLKTYGAIVVDRGGTGMTLLHQAPTDTSAASLALAYGGGALPRGTYLNDRQLRRLLAQCDKVVIPPLSYRRSDATTLAELAAPS